MFEIGGRRWNIGSPCHRIGIPPGGQTYHQDSYQEGYRADT